MDSEIQISAATFAAADIQIVYRVIKVGCQLASVSV